MCCDKLVLKLLGSLLLLIIPIGLLAFSVTLVIPPNPINIQLSSICNAKYYSPLCIHSNPMINYTCNGILYEFACLQSSPCANVEITPDYVCIDQSSQYSTIVNNFNLQSAQYPTNLMVGIILMVISVIIMAVIWIFAMIQYNLLA
jgi:hypothetical protein